MQTKISKQHINQFPELSQYALKKVEKLSKFDSKIISITIRLISEKAHRGQEQDYSCELVINLPGKNLSITSTERDMEKAVDKVVERAKRLIIKSKEKKISKKHKEGVLNKQ